MVSRLGEENASAFFKQRRDERILLVVDVVPKSGSSFSKVSFRGRERGPVCDLDHESSGEEVCAAPGFIGMFWAWSRTQTRLCVGV